MTNLIRGGLVIALIAGCHHNHSTPATATSESTMGQSTADTTPVPQPQPEDQTATGTTGTTGTAGTGMTGMGSEADNQAGNPTTVASTCPMDVDGAKVTTTSIDGGLALVFTTMSGDATDLRSRVRQMATDIEQNGLSINAAGTTTTGTPTTGTTATGTASTGAKGTMASDFDVTVVDVDHGARIEIKAKDKTKLDRVRADVRQEASQLQSGQCPLEHNKVSSR